MGNDEYMDLMLSDEELEKLGISFHEPTPEEIEEKRIKRAKELESKGFYRKMLNLMKPCLVHKN